MPSQAEQAFAEAQQRTNHQERQFDIAPTVLSFPALLQRDIPERKPLLPWLQERCIAMAYGERGVGKTQFGLSAALSLTTATPFLGWEAQHTDVLYVDGEMPLELIRDRLLRLAGLRQPQGLSILSSEVFYSHFERDLRLTDEAIRTAIDHYLDATPTIRVVVLDNISTLFTGISEDKKQDWEPINAWLIRLRHRAISSLLMHHAGKSGFQRGTSSREDVLDTVIALRRPSDYDPQDGCRFHLRFEKSRGLAGEAVRSLDVQLLAESEAWTWQFTPLEESQRDRVLALLTDGETSTRIIAEDVGCSESYVRRVKRQFDRGDV